MKTTFMKESIICGGSIRIESTKVFSTLMELNDSLGLGGTYRPSGIYDDKMQEFT
jgi:hypothetical protein